MEKRGDRGIISLEACISVISFLLLMLVLAGFFRMFMAQNMTAHAALETAQSLSLEAYSAKKLGNGSLKSVGDFINGLFGKIDDDNFSSYEDWFSSESKQAALPGIAKTRFAAYISGDSEQEADELLERLNVVDGMDGIDFSGSYVENGMLYIVVKYELKYDFKLGKLSTVKVNQKACAKLWE